MKARSSLTLFALADPAEPLYRQVIDAWFGGDMDQRTVEGAGTAE